jgi:DNA-binding MarR family transcriptional regulator
METQGLVEDAPDRPRADEDARRRYYRITREGRRAAEAESARLAALVATARRKDLLAEDA